MLTKEEAINKLNEIKRNTQHNGYMWASDVEDMFYKIYDEHERKLVHLKHIEDEVILLRNNRKELETQLKAKDEEIKNLNCRAYHAEGYINDLHNHPKDKKFYDAKARSIIAMLFWEARKTLTEYRNTKHCDALYNYYYGQKQQFIEAYAMLKDNA